MNSICLNIIKVGSSDGQKKREGINMSAVTHTQTDLHFQLSTHEMYGTTKRWNVTDRTSIIRNSINEEEAKNSLIRSIPKRHDQFCIFFVLFFFFINLLFRQWEWFGGRFKICLRNTKIHPLFHFQYG